MQNRDYKIGLNHEPFCHIRRIRLCVFGIDDTSTPRGELAVHVEMVKKNVQRLAIVVLLAIVVPD